MKMNKFKVDYTFVAVYKPNIKQHGCMVASDTKVRNFLKLLKKVHTMTDIKVTISKVTQ